MKTKFFSVAIAAATIFAACGTPRDTTTISSTSSNPAYSVPSNVQTIFVAQYPNATNTTWAAYDVAVVPIDWAMTGWTVLDPSDYTATFDMDGQRYYAFYDTEGNWVGSTYIIDDFSKLPAPVQATLSAKYSGYTITKVHQEMWKDHMAYEIKLKKTDDDKIKLIVDDQGNVLKEKLKD